MKLSKKLLSNTMKYFAYGSNTNFEQIKKRCPDNKFITSAYLEDYKFVYDGYSKTWKAAVANIIESKGEKVSGGVFEISDNDLKELDRYEGHPTSYQRKEMKVQDSSNESHEVWVYLRKDQKIGKPTEKYREMIKIGAIDCGLPKDYITIKKQSKSSITKEIPNLGLGAFTIFAGENNAGKTKLVRAIGDELRAKKINVIDIPAERVLAAAEIKTGADGDPFKRAISDLIEVSFDSKKALSSFVDDIDKQIQNEFSQYKVENIDIAINMKGAQDEDYKKAIKDTYVKKLIESITIKDKYCNKDGIKPEDVGQGTERLIIASLLRYLGDKTAKVSESKQTYIIFEEPEIYLHPKLKQTLYDTLINLATDEDNNIQIIITTHDPQFIELGRDFHIYKVFRNPDKDKGATQVSPVKDKGYLEYDSSAEINYLIFGLITKTYVLELYEKLKGSSKSKDFDDKIYTTLNIPQDQDPDPGCGNDKITFVSRLRHDIAHTKSQEKVDSFNKWGEDAVKALHDYSKATAT